MTRAPKTGAVAALLLLAVGCGEHSQVVTDAGPGPAGADLGRADAADDVGVSGAADAGPQREPCDPMKNKSCIEIKRGERTFQRWLTDLETVEVDDKGTTRTVVRLGELIDDEVAAAPGDWRYKIYGTDGYTFGDYLAWSDMLAGYIELGARRVVFDPARELPDSYFVKDAYLIVLSPGSSPP